VIGRASRVAIYVLTALAVVMMFRTVLAEILARLAEAEVNLTP
jgi:hypothetical protein